MSHLDFVYNGLNLHRKKKEYFEQKIGLIFYSNVDGYLISLYVTYGGGLLLRDVLDV